MAESHATLAPKKCLSTHGGAGYSYGDYWDGNAIVCGFCGTRIENPHPTGSRWIQRPGFWNGILRRGDWVPQWPVFIKGIPGA